MTDHKPEADDPLFGVYCPNEECKTPFMVPVSAFRGLDWQAQMKAANRPFEVNMTTGRYSAPSISVACPACSEVIPISLGVFVSVGGAKRASTAVGSLGGGHIGEVVDGQAPRLDALGKVPQPHEAEEDMFAKRRKVPDGDSKRWRTRAPLHMSPDRRNFEYKPNGCCDLRYGCENCNPNDEDTP